jgi:hypothetical protein
MNDSKTHLMPSSNGIQGRDINISGFSKEKQLKHFQLQTETRVKRPRPFIQDICNSFQTFFFKFKRNFVHRNSIRKRHKINVAILSHVFWETEHWTLRLGSLNWDKL